MVKSLCIASTLAAVANAQQAGTLQTENHPKLSYYECSANGCESVEGEITIDANWRWLHSKDDTTNCYTGNLWDESLCPDSKTCTANCVYEGADSEYVETYGVNVTSKHKLQLGFVTQGQYSKNVGSRVYLMDSPDTYKMFNLKNKEITYTVDDSNLGCGLNGALYFVQMEQDGGKKKYGNAGAKYGLGYCDAQCTHDLKFIGGEANNEDWVPSETDENAGTGKWGTCCTEIDLWEANSISSAFTMHACDTDGPYRCEGTDCGDNGEDRFKGVCDKNGCDIQSHRLQNTKFFGPGSEFTIDSTQPVTVTTRFITDDGTDTGKLVEVKQFYTQNGISIEHPEYTVNGNKHNTITEEFCKDWVTETKDGTNFLEKGGLDAVDKAFEAGVVLVMSLWDDHYANMLWLDSIYPTNSTEPNSQRGSCDITSGDPKDLEADVPDSSVLFAHIKYGPIGSTTSHQLIV